jgi:hypothetical protein
MNPADVAPAALPLVSADVSLIALFMQAHWVVKTVMLGLLACSVWVWAIAHKIFMRVPSAPWTASSRRSGRLIEEPIARCRPNRRGRIVPPPCVSGNARSSRHAPCWPADADEK